MSIKYSVIIPTMWYSPKTHQILTLLDDNDRVGEIILIDNRPSLKPKYLDQLKKLKYFPQRENIYVNPAWNLGVRLSSYDYLCILNDDIVFDTDIFEFMEDKMDTGVYGMWTGNYFQEKINLPFKIKEIKERVWGWGCMIFIHKSNWVMIDERLKIACGDDFLIKYVKGGAYQIHNLDIKYERMSTTTGKSQFLEQQRRDIELWNQY